MRELQEACQLESRDLPPARFPRLTCSLMCACELVGSRLGGYRAYPLPGYLPTYTPLGT